MNSGGGVLEEGRTNDLNLHIDLDQLLRQRIDLHQTRVHSAIEAAELRHQAYIALADGSVWVRAADAAGDGAKGSDDGSEVVDYAEKRTWSACVVFVWFWHRWQFLDMQWTDVLIEPYQP